MAVSSESVVATLKAQLLKVYARHVRQGSRYALVDFPDHPNVGDSAIWLGEIALLREITGRLPDYVSTAKNFDLAEFRKSCHSGTLFFHGGGNLGDIWPHHQKFREYILEHVRDRPVVQLPQSIKFRSEGSAQHFSDLIASHPDFTLYVRDRASLSFAQEHFACSIDLTPDSAFGMGPQVRSPAQCDVLMLMRTDAEKVAHDATPLDTVPSAEIVDWLQDSAGFARITKARRHLGRVWKGADSAQARVRWYNWLAKARVERGLRQLSRGRHIVTDRLHGHILATLLDIPHVALDNDYGKVSGYISAWTHEYRGVLTAKTPMEAVAKLASL